MFLKNQWNCKVRRNFFTKTCLTKNHFSHDPHFVIMHRKKTHDLLTENLCSLQTSGEMNYEMWITWKVIFRETCFCEKIEADFTVSWVFQKYFNFVPMLESRNVDHVKNNCSWALILWKILAEFTVSWVFQKYFNFVPMLESRNVDHMKV